MPYEKYPDVPTLLAAAAPALRLAPTGVEVADPARLRDRVVDQLAYSAANGVTPEVRQAAAWLIREAARALGVLSASIQPLYEARGRGEYEGVTVPAINIRGMTFDFARAVFRAAERTGAGAFIFELAKSEMGYTAQRPADFAASVLAAGIKEGWRGPVFVQGDHFQINAKNYARDPEGELAGLRALVREAIAAGYLNIDIDASTIVDLSKPTVREQQRENFERTAELLLLIRELEPAGVTISVGGEIGEVGKKNSTEEELRAYMDGLLEELARRRPGTKGPSKISVQTGTTHGGVVLPDGRIATVEVDFDTLERLSRVAREVYGMAGCVQHGASTLPDELFHLFPKVGTAEIHLATGFQNLMFESPAFPAEFRERIYAHLREAFATERAPGETDEQFLYKNRKRGYGPFKAAFWELPEAVRAEIGRELEAKLVFLFEQLGAAGTRGLVDRYVTPVPVPAAMPEQLRAAVR
ncbi:MAG TPA: class II fructose-bisphosphate aldolase [Thermodesulfobacteriota bacterium]|nr:class II fructose-bisphosphate aldolase [Thermodesulfobacteriota bacterium]